MLSSGVLLLLAALTLMPVPPGVEARNIKLPIGCDKEYIRQMVILYCGRFKRIQRSAEEAVPSKEVESRVPEVLPATLHRLDSVSDDLLHSEWLEYVEVGEDVERYIRADKIILKCCFKGCLRKDFIGIC